MRNQEYENIEDIPIPQHRGGCITAYLGVLLLFITLSALYNYRSLGDDVPTGAVLTALMSNAIALTGIIGLWRWKRWGLLLVVGIFAYEFVFRLFNGMSIGYVGGLAIGLGLLYFLYHDKWDWLE